MNHTKLNDMTFEELLEINCFSDDDTKKRKAAELLEWRYCCEIRCADMAKSVLFAHHARGCTVVAAKICENVVIFQNVTIGSNMRYNKTSSKWENVGSPIISKNVMVADGAKVLGPITIGENSLVVAGAIITKDIPANSIAFGVNQHKPKSPDYDYIYRSDNISGEEIMRVDVARVAEFEKGREV
jgi:serine O-acetyltransferase